MAAAARLSLAAAAFEALLLKAGRGAGWPLAHAEDLAFAVARHGGAEAWNALADAFEAGFAPRGGAGLGPVLLDARRAGADPALPDDPVMRALTVAEGPTSQDGSTRVDVPADLLARFEALAARLLVPASDASRAGAGTGA
ncbi:MAG: hypothetical protein ACU0CO_00070 [Shimia sp.]